MDISRHLFLGFIFALACFLVLPSIRVIGFAVIFLASFLIDVDHYIYYSLKKKDFNLRNAYNWHIKKRDKFRSLSAEKRAQVYGGFYFLHGIEILIFLLILSFFFIPILFIFTGFGFHLLLDYIDMALYGRIDKVSLIYDLKKFKKLIHIEDI
jgi:hypothetical protein